MRGKPLVSVIVIFLDEERFLAEAIDSVLAQSYDDWELLLCDDGSTDGSPDIARSYVERYADRVRYLTHERRANLGMSATRNLGLRQARGEFVSWLDGDDVWTPDKLERQVRLIQEHPEAALVYGRLHVWYGWTGRPEDIQKDFLQDLGVSVDRLIRPPELLHVFLEDDRHTPSGVLVRRRVLEEVGGYDKTFRGMHEDGIVHAKICLQWPAYASGESWYKYRQHPESECNQSIAAGTDKEALLQYLEWLENYLREQGRTEGETWSIVQKLLRTTRNSVEQTLGTRLSKGFRTAMRTGREIADQVVPRRIRRLVGLLGFRDGLPPPSGWLHMGNLQRKRPVSRVFGFDRGRPVDRYYIDRFLEEHAGDIRGRVLEIGDRGYTTRFGNGRVEVSDVLHARAGNPEATIVGDLSTGESIPTDAFDCIILTQVLPFLWDFRAAVEHTMRALKPGGVLLATVPGISQISRYDAEQWGDFWRFTSTSARRLFEDAFGAERVRLEVYGNVLAATAFLHGVASDELEADDLDYRDPDYEVTIAIYATKAAGA